ncbi:MAG: ATP-binding protein [Pseudomonadota bacterium]
MPLKKIVPSRSLLGLLLTYIGVGLGLGLLGVLALIYWVFTANTEMMVRDGLFGQAEEIAEQLRFDDQGQPQLTMHEPMQWGYDAFFANLKYRILDANGDLLLASDGGSGPLLPTGVNELISAPDYFTVEGSAGRLHVASFRFEHDGRGLIIQTARSDRFSELAAEAIMPAVFETAMVVDLGGFLILFLSITMAVRAAIRRIRHVSAAADVIKPENLDARLDTTETPRELIPLVEAFNDALDRIAEGYRVQQRFVANAAHELKTPLAIMRGQVELHGDPELRAQLLKDIDAMARNVQQMLHLSQVQDIRNYRFEHLNLRALAEEVVASFSGFPLLRNKKITVAGESGKWIRGDRAAAYTALRNLVENAIKWCHDDGAIGVEVLPTGYVVRDEGPGIEEASRHLLFERFWRADASITGGAGLGLSIAAEIARAHGGQISAANRADGKGAAFTLILNSDSRVAPGIVSPAVV